MIWDRGCHENHCFGLKAMVFYTFPSDCTAIDSEALEFKAIAAFKPNALESMAQDKSNALECTAVESKARHESPKH